MRVRQSVKDKGHYSDIKQRLKDIRLEHRLTQADLAKVVGLSASAVGAIEQGLYTPNFDVLRALNKRLGVSYSYIIDGIKDDTESIKRRVLDLEKENEMLKKVVAKLTK